MLILGCDPGPWEFAWVLYSDHDNAIVDHGTVIIGKGYRFPAHDYLCIEDMVAVWQRSAEVINTIKTIGWLIAMYPNATLIPRKTIATAITKSARSGDQEINAAIGKLVLNVPPPYTRHFTNHHRAALACAYVGVGRVDKTRGL